MKKIMNLRSEADELIRISLAECWKTMPYMKAQMVSARLEFNGYHTETTKDGKKIFYEFDGNADCAIERAEADKRQASSISKYSFPKLAL